MADHDAEIRDHDGSPRTFVMHRRASKSARDSSPPPRAMRPGCALQRPPIFTLTAYLRVQTASAIRDGTLQHSKPSPQPAMALGNVSNPLRTPAMALGNAFNRRCGAECHISRQQTPFPALQRHLAPSQSALASRKRPWNRPHAPCGSENADRTCRHSAVSITARRTFTDGRPPIVVKAAPADEPRRERFVPAAPG